MKKILLFTFLIISITIIKVKASVFLQTRNGVHFVTHNLQPNETIFQLSKDYSLRPNVLAKFNDVAFSTNLSKLQNIDIPLTETNFFKFASLNESGGFIKVLYKIDNNVNAKFICSKFLIDANSFHKWNESNDAETFESGDEVVVGWLKYANSRPQNNIPILQKETKTEIISEKPISKTIVAKPKSPAIKLTPSSHTLAEDTKDALNKIGSFIKKKTTPKPKDIKKESVNKEESIAAIPKRVNKDPNRDKESLSDKSKAFIGKLKNKIAPEKQDVPKPIVKNNTAVKKNTTTTIKNLDVRPTTKVIVQKEIKNTSDEKEIEYTATKIIKKETKVSEKKEEEKVEEVVVEKKIEETPKIVKAKPEVVHHDIKKINFTNTKTGKAAYFFSGPVGGKFYVVTSLATKGKMLKITNTETGKSIVAEVLGALPSSDASKGILVKISDNAKLPLKQTKAPFNVKINY